MENYEAKKLLILRILEVLTDDTDSEHRLAQVEIKRLLALKYGIECDRKAIARNIDFLQQAGYDIVVERTGCYLASRKFEYSELRLLIDCVLANRNVSKVYTRQLIEKLTAEGTKYFKQKIKHIHNLDDWQKTQCPDYFLNIELLGEAIDNKKKVKFCLMTYGMQKVLVKKNSEPYTVSVYQLVLKNGFYYLLCNFDGHNNMVFCRLDRLSALQITTLPVRELATIEGGVDGLNLGEISNRLPYLFADKAERIEFLINKSMINDIVDWFGTKFYLQECTIDSVKISLIASPRAIRFWILQFGRYIKVLSPQSLVDIIKEDISAMQQLYE